MMLFLVFAMILLSAFFVLAEFSFLRVRMMRVEQLIDNGNKKAVSLKKVLNNLDEVLSVCQIGITVTSLVLGALGEPAIAHLLEPLFSDLGVSDVYLHSVSFVAAIVLVTYLHVVLGEMLPKSIAIRYSEGIALNLAKITLFAKVVLKPIVLIFNGSSNVLLKLLGLRSEIVHTEIHSQEDLKHIMEESHDHGEIASNELEFVKNVFTSSDLTAREIMTPRVDMVTVDIGLDNKSVLSVISSEQFTRFPVTQNNDKDKIVGFINAKDFLISIANHETKTVKDFVRANLYIHESTPIIELMQKMQNESIHFAIALDEYGGTNGIITLEDVLEELVGDIRDEFDGDEKSSIEKIDDRIYIVDGQVLLSEINTLLDVELEADSVDTIGGIIFQNNQNAEVGNTFTFENVIITLLEVEDNRYKRVQIEKLNKDIITIEKNKETQDSE